MTRVTEMRRATVEDAESIAAIVRGLGSEDTGLPKDFGIDRIREWIQRLGDQGTAIVAYDGSIPIAFGTLDITTMEPETGLLGVWVLPEHRRKGVQSALLRHRLSEAARRGCDVAVVTTGPGSKSQENVQKAGFALLYARAVLVRKG